MRASRITYVGELGWELYVPAEHCLDVYEQLLAPVRRSGCGTRATTPWAPAASRRATGTGATTSATRTRRSRRDSASPWPGTSPAASWAATRCWRRTRARRAAKRLVQVMLDDASDTAPLLYHEEPIVRDGVIVGSISSGAWGHRLGRSIGMGYVSCDDGVTQEWLGVRPLGSRSRLPRGIRPRAAATLVRPAQRAHQELSAA